MGRRLLGGVAGGLGVLVGPVAGQGEAGLPEPAPHVVHGLAGRVLQQLAVVAGKPVSQVLQG